MTQLEKQINMLPKTSTIPDATPGSFGSQTTTDETTRPMMQQGTCILG